MRSHNAAVRLSAACGTAAGAVASTAARVVVLLSMLVVPAPFWLPAPSGEHSASDCGRCRFRLRLRPPTPK